MDVNDFTSYDLSEIPKEQKDMIVNEFTRITGETALKVFRSLGLKQFIECMVTDDNTGDEFILSFRKVEKNVWPPYYSERFREQPKK